MDQLPEEFLPTAWNQLAHQALVDLARLLPLVRRQEHPEDLPEALPVQEVQETKCRCPELPRMPAPPDRLHKAQLLLSRLLIRLPWDVSEVRQLIGRRQEAPPSWFLLRHQ